MPKGLHPNSRAQLRRTAGPGRPKGARNKLSAERVEEELRRIALMDPVELFERFRDPKTGKRRRTFTLREIHEMPPEMRACIASVKVRTENLTSGDDEQDQTVEVRLWNKIDALTLCAKHFGWVTDKAEVTVHVEELLERLDRGRLRNAERRRALPPARSVSRGTIGPRS